MFRDRMIVLAVTGGIAAYKSATLVRELKKSDAEVLVIMTEDATEFITPLTFETISQNPVAVNMFDRNNKWTLEHIALADRADLLIVAPATANIIAKLAAGICDDLLSCTVCASKAKVLIAPAMNENMYNHKITQSNIAKLKSCNYKFVLPRKGLLACGEEGVGCLAEIAEIVKEVKKIL